MIARDVPPFIDGRAELYGEKFVMSYFNAVEGRQPGDLLRMLDEYKMDATLLSPDSPAARIIDLAQGWKKIYADDVAVERRGEVLADASEQRCIDGSVHHGPPR